VCVITSVAAATLFNRRAAQMNGKRSSRKLPIRRNERVPTVYMYIINARSDLSSAAVVRSVSLIVVRARAPPTRHHHNIYIYGCCRTIIFILYIYVCVYVGVCGCTESLVRQLVPAVKNLAPPRTVPSATKEISRYRSPLPLPPLPPSLT